MKTGDRIIKTLSRTLYVRGGDLKLCVRDDGSVWVNNGSGYAIRYPDGRRSYWHGSYRDEYLTAYFGYSGSIIRIDLWVNE